MRGVGRRCDCDVTCFLATRGHQNLTERTASCQLMITLAKGTIAANFSADITCVKQEISWKSQNLRTRNESRLTGKVRNVVGLLTYSYQYRNSSLEATSCWTSEFSVDYVLQTIWLFVKLL